MERERENLRRSDLPASDFRGQGLVVACSASGQAAATQGLEAGVGSVSECS